MDNVYLSINSLEIMNKLFTGKEEVLISISNAILKKWEEEQILPKFDEEMEEEFIRKFRLRVKKEIREKVAEEIKYEELEKYVEELVHKAILKMIDGSELSNLIDTTVKDQVEKRLKKIKI